MLSYCPTRLLVIRMVFNVDLEENQDLSTESNRRQAMRYKYTNRRPAGHEVYRHEQEAGHGVQTHEQEAGHEVHRHEQETGHKVKYT